MADERPGGVLACTDCGYAVPVDTLLAPCPSCGCAKLIVTFAETVPPATDLAKAKGTDADGRTVMRLKAGLDQTKDGPLAGSFATVSMLVDRIAGRYIEKVILSNGTVVKDVNGPLGDQSLHGGPHLGDGVPRK